MIDVKATLELTRNGIQKTFYSKAGNNTSVRYIINLAANGKVLDLSDEAFTVAISSDNGTEILDYSEWGAKEGTGYAFSPPAFAAGERLFEFKVMRGEQVLYTPLFAIIFEPSNGDDDWEEPGKPILYQPLIANAPEIPVAEIGDDYVVIYSEELEQPVKVLWAALAATVFSAEDREAFEGLVEAKHTHSNKLDVLDKLGVSEGKLTFNGQPIGGGGSSYTAGDGIIINGNEISAPDRVYKMTYTITNPTTLAGTFDHTFAEAQTAYAAGKHIYISVPAMGAETEAYLISDESIEWSFHYKEGSSYKLVVARLMDEDDIDIDITDLGSAPPEVHIGDSAPTGEELLWVDTDEDDEPDDVATKAYVDAAIAAAIGNAIEEEY